MRPAPPSLRASRSGAWAPKTAYARGVMTTGHLKRPSCPNGGATPRSLHGRCAQRASTVYARRVALGCLRPLPRRTRSPATASWHGAPSGSSGVKLAPAGIAPLCPYRQRAMSRRRAKATIPMRRMRLPPRAKRVLHQRLRAEGGCERHPPQAIWSLKVRRRLFPAWLMPWSRARSPLAEGLGVKPASAAPSWRFWHCRQPKYARLKTQARVRPIPRRCLQCALCC
jgi:hypothetical protein